MGIPDQQTAIRTVSRLTSVKSQVDPGIERKIGMIPDRLGGYGGWKNTRGKNVWVGFRIPYPVSHIISSIDIEWRETKNCGNADARCKGIVNDWQSLRGDEFWRLIRVHFAAELPQEAAVLRYVILSRVFIYILFRLLKRKEKDGRGTVVEVTRWKKVI
jgi:hypothetical protein